MPTPEPIPGLEPNRTTGEFDINAPVADADTRQYKVEVGAGTVAARFSLDAADDTADLDLFVYLGGVLVDLSASGAADEQVTVTTLAGVEFAAVDMRTLLIVGSSTTRTTAGGAVYTPRRYP